MECRLHIQVNIQNEFAEKKGKHLGRLGSSAFEVYILVFLND